MNTQHSVTRVARRPDPARKKIIRALTGFRREWQETAGTGNLVDLAVPVGLVIADVTERLGLTRQEQISILGVDLDAAVTSYLQEPIRLK